MKAALLALAIGIGIESAEAQGRARSGYSGYVAAGVSRIANSELHDRLGANGYPAFSRTPRAVNIGAYRLLRSGVMLGGEWHFHNVGNGKHEGREVGLGAGYATLGVAFALDRSPRARFYPRLGLGVGGMGLWSEAAGLTPASGFDEWLATPAGDPDTPTLSQASMVVDLGGGAEFLFRRNGGGPLLGLRAGYVATPFDQGWTQHGRAIEGAPRATVAGPYVRAMIGWRRERQ